MKKKCLSLFLCLLLAIGLIPAAAMADSDPAAPTDIYGSVGDYFYLSTSGIDMDAFSGNILYTWELSTDAGVTWTAISKADYSSDFYLNVYSSQMQGYLYRCFVSDGTTNGYSDTLRLNIQPFSIDKSTEIAISSLTSGSFSASSSLWLSRNGYYNAYKVHLTKDTVLAAAMTADDSDALDCYLYLYDANGNFLTSNDDHTGSDSFLRYAVTETGDYYLLASHFVFSDTYLPDMIGQGYSLDVFIDTNVSTATLPSTISGTFDSNTNEKSVTVNLKKGDIVYCSGISSNSNGFFARLGIDGTNSCRQLDGVPYGAYQIPEDGTYILTVINDGASDDEQNFEADIQVIHADLASLPTLALNYSGPAPTGGASPYSADDLDTIRLAIGANSAPEDYENNLAFFNNTIEQYAHMYQFTVPGGNILSISKDLYCTLLAKDMTVSDFRSTFPLNGDNDDDDAAHYLCVKGSTFYFGAYPTREDLMLLDFSLGNRELKCTPMFGQHEIV